MNGQGDTEKYPRRSIQTKMGIILILITTFILTGFGFYQFRNEGKKDLRRPDQKE